VNINDDAAEKRRRRKSTKITVVENAMAGPSSEGHMDTDAAETSRTARQKQQLNSVAPPPVINVPKDVMSSNFEEWMKMATDNVHTHHSYPIDREPNLLRRKLMRLILGTLLL
jgi:condensin complex subunit 2